MRVGCNEGLAGILNGSANELVRTGGQAALGDADRRELAEDKEDILACLPHMLDPGPSDARSLLTHGNLNRLRGKCDATHWVFEGVPLGRKWTGDVEEDRPKDRQDQKHREKGDEPSWSGKREAQCDEEGEDDGWTKRGETTKLADRTHVEGALPPVPM